MTTREPRGNDDQQQEELKQLLEEAFRVKYRVILLQVEMRNRLRRLDSIQSELEALKKRL